MKSTAKYVLLIALLLSLLTGAYAETQNTPYNDTSSTSNTYGYALGLTEETPEEKALADSLLTFSANGGNELPPQFDNSAKFPVPGNQGTMKSCVSWACVYALKSYQEQVEHQWEYSAKTVFSPLYTYNQLNGGRNEGTNIQQTMAILVNQGACPLEEFPYNENAYGTIPTESQRESASKYRSQEFFTVKGVNDFKNAIYNYGGIVVGIEVFDNFHNMNRSTSIIYDTFSGKSDGMHAICLTGWDDNLRAFRFINSWGAQWGDGGFGWISYDIATSNGYGYAMKMDIEQHDDVYTVVFNSNGGGGSMDSIEVNRDTRFSVPLNEFSKGNANFLGWMVYSENNNGYLHFNEKKGYSYKSEDMSIQVIIKDGQIWSNLTSSGDTLTFKAVWDVVDENKPDNYTISFNPNGGTGSMQSISAEPGTIKLPGNLFQRDGYQFGGWFAYIQSADDTRNNKYVYIKDNTYTLFIANENDPGWSPVIFTDNQEIIQFAHAGETIVFVAIWKDVENSDAYTIAFNPNGGTGSMQSISAGSGMIKLPSSLFQRDGYQFDGWFAYIQSADEARNNKYVYKKDSTYTLFTANENDPGWSPVIFTDNQEIIQFAHAGETIVFVAIWKDIENPDA